jgi:hypothetical protein
MKYKIKHTLDFIQIKKFVHKKIKMQATDQEEIFETYQTKHLYPEYTKSLYNSIISNSIQQNLSNHIEDMQMVISI